MTQHTKGPWTVDPNISNRILSETADPDYVAQTALAEDARLIAAAPELLEALRGLLSSAPAPKDIRKDYSYILYREAAKNTLAKATK